MSDIKETKDGSANDITCPSCGKECNGKRGLAIHRSKSSCGKKVEEKELTCTSLKGNLIEEEKSEVNKKDQVTQCENTSDCSTNETQCVFCGKVCKGKRGLASHRSKSGCKQTKKEEDIEFPERSLIIAGRTEVNKQYSMTECQQTSKASIDVTEQDLNAPTECENASHDYKNEIQCPSCGKICKGKRGLAIHHSRSSCGKNPKEKDIAFPEVNITAEPSPKDDITKEIKCPSCGKGCKGKRGLAIHRSKSSCGQKGEEEEFTVIEGNISAKTSPKENNQDTLIECQNAAEASPEGNDQDTQTEYQNTAEPSLKVNEQDKMTYYVNTSDGHIDKGVLADFQNKAVYAYDDDVYQGMNSAIAGKSKANTDGITEEISSDERNKDWDFDESYGSDEEEFIDCEEEFYLTEKDVAECGNHPKIIKTPNDTGHLKKADISAAAEVINRFIYELFYAVKDMASTQSLDIGVLRSGSYYDRTKNKEPDEFDFMFFPQKLRVDVEFDTENHGYCKVKLRNQDFCPTFIKDAVIEKGYVKPDVFKKIFFDIFESVLTSSEFRPGRKTKKKERDEDSPAYTVLNHGIPGKEIDIDLVPCIEINGWPQVATQVKPNWIDSKYYASCMNKYHVVAKKCPDENAKDRDLLWRVSFSWAEKILIFRTRGGAKGGYRKDVFKRVKLILENTKTDNEGKIKKFCSYHLKMFFFSQYGNWPNEKYQTILKGAMENLHRALSENNDHGCACIQNYFIPDDNVVKHVPKGELDLFRAELEKNNSVQKKD